MTDPETGQETASLLNDPERAGAMNLREQIMLLEGIEIQAAPNWGQGAEKIVRGTETVGFLVQTRSGCTLRYYSAKGGWRLETNPEKALEIIRNGSIEKRRRRERPKDAPRKTDGARVRAGVEIEPRDREQATKTSE